ncbi:MAG: hypothetical protein Q9213_002894 [Squamulea squamosa]
MSSLLSKTLAQRRVRTIGTSEIAFQPFTGPVNAIGTYNIPAGCLVLIVSRQGAVIAHLAQAPAFHDAHAGPMMEVFVQLYKAKRMEYFRSINETWVVIGSIIGDDEGQDGRLEDGMKVVNEKLAAVGLGERVEQACRFELRSSGKGTAFPGKGTFLVDAKGPQLDVFVDDRRISLE